MSIRVLIILAVIILAEYYSFVTVRAVLRDLSPSWRTWVTILYLLLTAMSWLGLILFRRINWANVPHLLRNVYIAFVLGFVVGKILVLLVMLVDDIRRLITWLVGALAYRNSPAADSSASIDRSLFLKRTALVLGGLSV